MRLFKKVYEKFLVITIPNKSSNLKKLSIKITSEHYKALILQ